VSLVLDSSITVAWLYREEATKSIDEIVETLIQASAWVPGLWHLEVANVLQVGYGASDIRQIFATESFLICPSFLFMSIRKRTGRLGVPRHDWPNGTG
jgi:hypothetical protein